MNCKFRFQWIDLRSGYTKRFASLFVPPVCSCIWWLHMFYVVMYTIRTPVSIVNHRKQQQQITQNKNRFVVAHNWYNNNIPIGLCASTRALQAQFTICISFFSLRFFFCYFAAFVLFLFYEWIWIEINTKIAKSIICCNRKCSPMTSTLIDNMLLCIILYVRIQRYTYQKHHIKSLIRSVFFGSFHCNLFGVLCMLVTHKTTTTTQEKITNEQDGKKVYCQQSTFRLTIPTRHYLSLDVWYSQAMCSVFICWSFNREMGKSLTTSVCQAMCSCEMVSATAVATIFYSFFCFFDLAGCLYLEIVDINQTYWVRDWMPIYIACHIYIYCKWSNELSTIATYYIFYLCVGFWLHDFSSMIWAFKYISLFSYSRTISVTLIAIKMNRMQSLQSTNSDASKINFSKDPIQSRHTSKLLKHIFTDFYWWPIAIKSTFKNQRMKKIHFAYQSISRCK